MARMRGLDEAFNMIVADDPETALTKTALRRLVKNGTIPHIKVGRKILLNFDKLIEFLTGSQQQKQSSKYTTGVIRRVD